MEFWSKFKRSANNAFKSVIFNGKEFVGIYVSVIIVQMLLGIWTITSFTNYTSSDELFDSRYSHDLTVDGSTASIVNLSNILRYDQMTDCASFTDFKLLTGDGVSRLKVTLKNNGFEDFFKEYLEKLYDNGDISYELTPKYVYHSSIQTKILAYSIVIGVIVLLVGLLILNVMYSIRTNHYKYQYGVYMACGADKRMLGGIAMSELAAISSLTVLPSAILSYVAARIVYIGTGSEIKLSFPMILVYISLCAISVLLSTGFTVGSLFIKTPISLITTADNSNFVSSPRRSFDIFGKKMPLHYELASSWRFRKYLARLVLGAVGFSVIFIVGIYSANMIKAENEAPKEEFIIKYQYSTAVSDLADRANSEAETFIDELKGVDGVEKISCEQSAGFGIRMDHLLLKSGMELSGADFTVPSLNEYDGYTRAMNNCKYVCLNPVAIELYADMYEIDYLEGYDAERILSSDDTVVLTESMFGAKCFDFKPGDKIVIAEMTAVKEQMRPDTDPKKQLRQQISSCSFDYTELTVGAVIRDSEATDRLTVALSPKLYESFTSDSQAISEVRLFVSSGLDLDGINKLRDDIDGVMDKYADSWDVDSTDDSVYAVVDGRINLPSLIYLLSILVLVVSPVVWIFSQIMFYKKRETEFMILRAMGATIKEIGGLHLVSGVLIFLVSFISNFAMSRLLCFIIYKIFGRILPELGITGLNVPFDSFVPASTVLIYAALSALCGILSSMIPYLLYRRRLLAAEKGYIEQNNIITEE